MVIGLVGWFPRSPGCRVGPQHPGRSRRMVLRPAVLQCAAGRHGGGAAGPGADRSTRHGLRSLGGLSTDRVGERHLRGPAVRRQPARHVPGPVCARRTFHRALCHHAERSAAREGGSADLVAGESSPARSTSTPGRAQTSAGLPPAASCSFWRTHLRPPTRPTTCWTRSAAPRPRCHARYSSAPSPSRSSSSSRPSSVALPDWTGPRKIFVLSAAIVSAWRCRARDRQRLQWLPRRHGDQRTRLRDVAGRRPGARRRRAAEPGRVREGPRRVEHCRALPFAIAPAIAPAILAIGGGSYSVLYALAGVCAIIGAVASFPGRRPMRPTMSSSGRRTDQCWRGCGPLRFHCGGLALALIEHGMAGTRRASKRRR